MQQLVSRSYILLLCILVREIAPASAYALTSQYLGAAPSSENEHLLLFKLPETISAQLLESQSRNHNKNHQYVLRESRSNLHSQPQRPSLDLQSYQQPYQAVEISHDQRRPENEPAMQEQAVSLTIPLVSNLHVGRPSTNYAGDGQSSQGTLDQVQAQRASQLGLELAIAEYIAANQQENNDNLTQSIAAQRDYSPADPRLNFAANSASSVAGHNVTHDFDAGASRRLIARQLALLAANQMVDMNHSNKIPSSPVGTDSQHSSLQSQLAATDRSHYRSQSGLDDNQQPRLWRDTQIAYSPLASQSNGSDISSLLAKLSQSPPDLLIRLKKLLKKGYNPVPPESSQGGASIDARLKSSSTGDNLSALDGLRQIAGGLEDNNELLMANNVAPRELKQLVQNYLDNRLGSTSATSGDDSTSPLKAFLSSSNITTHEEIKIPLIVIAMPRILSLRKNQTGSNSPIASLNSSLPSISAVLAQRLALQRLPRVLAPSLTQNTTQYHNDSHLYQSDSNQPPQPNQPNTASVHQLYSASQRYGSNSAYNQQNQALIASTTSIPIHTSAPYAQQFFMSHQSSVPSIRQFVPIQAHPGEDSQNGAYHAQTNIRLLSPQAMTNQSNIYLSSEGQGTNAPLQPSRTVRPLVESMIAGRDFRSAHNSAGDDRIQVLAVLDGVQNNNAGYQVRGLSLAGQANDNHHQKHQSDTNNDARGHERYATRSQPAFELQQTLEQIPANESQEQQQIILLDSAAQNRSIDPSNGVTTSNSSFVEGAQFRPLFEPAKSQSGYADHLDAVASVVEEQVGKLRPLFRANKRSMFPVDTRNSGQSSKLTPSQLLSLFSRSNENVKRNWTPREFKARSDTRQPGASPGVPGKKSPRMVFMIV